MRPKRTDPAKESVMEPLIEPVIKEPIERIHEPITFSRFPPTWKEILKKKQIEQMHQIEKQYKITHKEKIFSHLIDD